VSYGDIVAKGDMARNFTPEQLGKMPVKPAAERRLIGKHAKARDIPGQGPTARGSMGSTPRFRGWSMRGPKLPPTA